MCSHHTSKGGPNLKFEFAKKNGGGPNCGISIQSGLLTLSVSASLFVLRLPCKALHIPTYQQVQRRFFRPPSQLLLRPHTALSSLDEISAALPLTISRPSSYQMVRNLAIVDIAPPTFIFQILKAGAFLASRGFCSSILTPESSNNAFPSELLSAKPVASEERKIGLYQDLMIPVTNFQNEDKGFMLLAGDVFDVPIRKDIIHRVVRWQLAKRQQILSISGDDREHIRQKQLVRLVEQGESHGNKKVLAEQGMEHCVVPRGGATMHGPKPRSHAFKLNKKVRRLGLMIALSARVAEGKLLVFDNLDVTTHKTKNIVKYVNTMENTKKVLLVDGGPINEKLKLATQNLHYVNVLPSIGLNVYSILLHDTLVMSRDAVERIVTRMHTPINR
uniref:Large ribosomal subunit protein uL4m n=1 Tax=Cucumis melo TaxID=3656 RepID=A0A9I9CRT2_CUCME